MNRHNQELVNRYLSLRGNNITDRTREAFRDDLRVFLKYLGDIRIEEVTHRHIDGFIQYCREDRGNGDAALSRKYNTLNKFYDTMIFKEYLDIKNPMTKVERIRVRTKVRQHLSLDEYRQIMDHLNTRGDRRGLALFSLLYSSGLRVGEVSALNIQDVDFDNRELMIFKGKGEKGRTAIFSKETKKYILNYLKARRDDLEPLFISREHNRWAISSIQRFVRDTGVAAGIKKRVHPHLIRHGTAMLLLDKGLSLDEIQKVLGHENISTTQIYARTSMGRVKRNVDSIYKGILD